jgi:hypothetical protein
MSFEDFLSSEAEKAPNPTGAIAPDALTPPNDFATFLARSKGETTQAAQAVSVANAHSGISAQQAGQAAQTGRQLGLPQTAVETDPQVFQAQAKAKANTELLASNPVLAQWVAANPDSARIAQDEYDKLSSVEQLWKGTQTASYEALRQLGGSMNSGALALNRVLGAPLHLIPGAAEWWTQNMLQPLEKGEKALAMPENATFGQKAAGTVGSLLGLLSQITLTGGAGAAEAVPATAGALATVANAVTNASRAMAFPSLTASVNTGHDVYAQTNDAMAAAKASMGAYAFSTIQGLVPFSAPGGAAGRFMSGGLSGAATGEAQRSAMNLLLPDQMRTEFKPDEVIFNALTGAVLGGVMGPRHDAHLYEAVRQTYTDALKAEKAERDIGRIATLGHISAESELRKSDPDAFHEFVRTVSDNSDLDAVYVNGTKLSEAFAQSKMEPTPEIAQQMREAIQTGGDVRIPVADYATHIAGTDLEKAILPEMKAAPDGMTMAEGQAFYQKAAEAMKAKAKEVGAERQQAAELDADKANVLKTIHEQMVAAGREPSVAKTEATLIAEFYSTMAQREGMKPSEMFAQNPVRFASEQAPARSPETQALIDTRKRHSVLTSIMECMA